MTYNKIMIFFHPAEREYFDKLMCRLSGNDLLPNQSKFVLWLNQIVYKVQPDQIYMLFHSFGRIVVFILGLALMVSGCFFVSGFRLGPTNLIAPTPIKPRLIILTDISSLKPRYLEPDDGQAMIRLMLYANSFDIEGLIATSNMGHGLQVQPELIHEVIDAYGKVQPNLVKHDPVYPSADKLHALVKSGQPKATPKAPINTFFGKDFDTEASNWIIHMVDQPDPRPVWVCVWGGMADLAQALWNVQQTRPKAAVEAFVKKLRVRAITDQDSTGGWILKQFPDLFYVNAHKNFRGMYRGGNTKLTDSLWVETHLHNPANPLGMLYPNYWGGDSFREGPGSVKGIKEGDTPSYLSLIPNGLNLPEHPELGSWGGIFSRIKPTYFLEKVDSTASFATDKTPYMASVYRWRPDWQSDFRARLDWCGKTYQQANHYPNVVVNGHTSAQPIEQMVRSGQTVTFDAGKSSDPDGNSIRYHWQIYPQSVRSRVTLQGIDSPKLTVQINAKATKQMVPILLTVMDNGQPALRQYRRILLHVK